MKRSHLAGSGQTSAIPPCQVIRRLRVLGIRVPGSLGRTLCHTHLDIYCLCANPPVRREMTLPPPGSHAGHVTEPN